MKRLLIAAAVFGLTATAANAQSPCPTGYPESAHYPGWWFAAEHGRLDTVAPEPIAEHCPRGPRRLVGAPCELGYAAPFHCTYEPRDPLGYARPFEGRAVPPPAAHIPDGTPETLLPEPRPGIDGQIPARVPGPAGPERGGEVPTPPAGTAVPPNAPVVPSNPPRAEYR